MLELYRVKVDEGRRVSYAVKSGERELTLLKQAPWHGLFETAIRVPLDEASLLAPAEPTKVVCVGRNYGAHARELGHDIPEQPLLFLKPPSSVIGPGDTIELPPTSQRVDHESELAVVIGRRCKRVSAANALDFVLGYTCLNDVTARDLQKRDGQWARAKGYDTFCPIGPRIVTGLDPRNVTVTCWVNSELRQRGVTSDLIFPIADIIAYISEAMTLEPGDVIATGTPEGVGPLSHGDTVEVSIDPIGTLMNKVVARPAV